MKLMKETAPWSTLIGAAGLILSVATAIGWLAFARTDAVLDQHE